MSQRVRPVYDELDEEDFLGGVLQQEEGDEYEDITFGALNEAQKKLRHKDDEAPQHTRPNHKSKRERPEKKKRSKHGPSELSAKKPVGVVREIPGLESKKDSLLYTDIRFDAAYGKADLQTARKNYAFLDDYRKQEIKNMEEILRDKKRHNYLTEGQEQELRNKLQILKSRMDTLRNRDLEHNILEEHKRTQQQAVREGKQVNPYFLKKSEQRKILQKAKFDSMKGKQREKVMERKRKKRLGKEFRQMEFRQNQ